MPIARYRKRPHGAWRSYQSTWTTVGVRGVVFSEPSAHSYCSRARPETHVIMSGSHHRSGKGKHDYHDGVANAAAKQPLLAGSKPSRRRGKKGHGKSQTQRLLKQGPPETRSPKTHREHSVGSTTHTESSRSLTTGSEHTDFDPGTRSGTFPPNPTGGTKTVPESGPHGGGGRIKSARKRGLRGQGAAGSAMDLSSDRVTSILGHTLTQPDDAIPTDVGREVVPRTWTSYVKHVMYDPEDPMHVNFANNVILVTLPALGTNLWWRLFNLCGFVSLRDTMFFPIGLVVFLWSFCWDHARDRCILRRIRAKGKAKSADTLRVGHSLLLASKFWLAMVWWTWGHGQEVYTGFCGRCAVHAGLLDGAALVAVSAVSLAVIVPQKRLDRQWALLSPAWWFAMVGLAARGFCEGYVWSWMADQNIHERFGSKGVGYVLDSVGVSFASSFAFSVAGLVTSTVHWLFLGLAKSLDDAAFYRLHPKQRPKDAGVPATPGRSGSALEMRKHEVGPETLTFVPRKSDNYMAQHARSDAASSGAQ